MDAQRQELDHFGPWVLEVGPSDPPPPLFLPHLDPTREPLLAIKVPRPIERRDVRPGMDLYDYLLCLYPDGIVVLRRDGREVRRWACGYQDVGWVSLSRALLQGTLHLDTAAGGFDLPFSTADDAPIRHVIDLVRERYPRPRVPIGAAADALTDGSALSFGFQRQLAELCREDPTIRPVALQGTVPLGGQEAGLGWGALMRVAGRRLLESMHLVDGRELLILDRGTRFAYRWESIYGSVATWIPLASIRSVDVTPGRDAALVTLRTAGTSVVHAFTLGHPWLAACQRILGPAHPAPSLAA
ncbi:MAG: hypothetical protein U0667_14540 [Chloroflexota bacterium]